MGILLLTLQKLKGIIRKYHERLLGGGGGKGTNWQWKKKIP